MLKKVLYGISLVSLGFVAGYATKSFLVSREEESEETVEDNTDDNKGSSDVEESFEEVATVNSIFDLADAEVYYEDDEDEEDENDEDNDDEEDNDEDDDEDDEDDEPDLSEIFHPVKMPRVGMFIGPVGSEDDDDEDEDDNDDEEDDEEPDDEEDEDDDDDDEEEETLDFDNLPLDYILRHADPCELGEYLQKKSKQEHDDEDDDDEEDEEVEDDEEDEEEEDEEDDIVEESNEDEDETEESEEEVDNFNKEMLNSIANHISTEPKDLDVTKTSDPAYVDENFYQCACGKYRGIKNLNKYCKKCNTRVKQLQVVFGVGGGGLIQNSIKYPANIKLDTTSSKDKEEPLKSSKERVVGTEKNISEAILKEVLKSNEEIKQMEGKELAVTNEEEKEEVKLDDNVEEQKDETELKRAELMETYYKPIVESFRGDYQSKLARLIGHLAQPDFDPDAYNDYTTRLEACIHYHTNQDEGNSFLDKIITSFETEFPSNHGK